MDLSPYLETVRQGVTSAAALGDDSTRQTAERLGVPPLPSPTWSNDREVRDITPLAFDVNVTS